VRIERGGENIGRMRQNLVEVNDFVGLFENAKKKKLQKIP
jgi:hypothetical protein